MSGDMRLRKVTKPVRLTLERDFNGIFLPLRLGNRMVRFLVDTGACWTLMSLDLLDKCGLLAKMTVIHEAGLLTIGVLEAEAEAQGGYMLHFVVAIMQRLGQPLLGMNFLLRYGCMLVLDPQLPIMEVRPSRCAELGQMSGVYKRCKLRDRPVTAILDTGSTHSFIGRALSKTLKLPRRFCKPMLVTLFDGSITLTCGKVKSAEIDIDGLLFSTDLIIHPRLNIPLLLGMNILFGSNLCLDEKQLTLSTANPCYIGEEQEPKPTSVYLKPPVFSILNNSSSFVSTSATERTHARQRLKNWFKNLRPKWLGSGQSRTHETVNGSRNETENVENVDNVVNMEEERASEASMESDEEMTTATEEVEESVSESDEQQNGSEK